MLIIFLTGFREAVHLKAKFYEGDIRDRAYMDSVFEKEDSDGVIHFAASSQVGESMKAPLKYYSNNLCGAAVSYTHLDVYKRQLKYCAAISISLSRYTSESFRSF